jgi:hypothetical protein
MGAATSEREVYEEQFRRAGLPLRIAGRKAEADIWNRAAPLLGFVFAAELSNNVNLGLNLQEEAVALTVTLAIVAAGFFLWNLFKHRPLLALPESVGWRGLAVFAFVPSIRPLLFGDFSAALLTALGNLLLLAVVFTVLWFGLIQIVVWAGRRLVGQLGRSLGLLTRAVPMLLLFSVVLFVNTEMWQVFARMSDASLIAVVGLLVLSGAGFVLARIGREVDEILAQVSGDAPPLSRLQRANISLVLFVSHALQVLVVALSIAGFFIAFGLLAISSEVIVSWLGSAGDELLFLDLFGVEIHLTAELLRVSAAIAAFSGLFFAIAVFTEEAYRNEFLKEATTEMRQTFAVRMEYLALLGSGGGGIRTHETPEGI